MTQCDWFYKHVCNELTNKDGFYEGDCDTHCWPVLPPHNGNKTQTNDRDDSFPRPQVSSFFLLQKSYIY